MMNNKNDWLMSNVIKMYVDLIKNAIADNDYEQLLRFNLSMEDAKEIIETPQFFFDHLNKSINTKTGIFKLSVDMQAFHAFCKSASRLYEEQELIKKALSLGASYHNLEELIKASRKTTSALYDKEIAQKKRPKNLTKEQEKAFNDLYLEEKINELHGIEKLKSLITIAEKVNITISQMLAHEKKVLGVDKK